MSPESIRMIHLADLHIGTTRNSSLRFKAGEQFSGRSVGGRYVRQVDLEQAVEWLIQTLPNQQPNVDIVVIAGDLFDTCVPPPRAIRYVTLLIKSLTDAKIETVIIDGNHEYSSDVHVDSPTTYLRELGAHVINGRNFEIVQGDQWQLNSRLRDRLVVTALPYRALKSNTTAIVPLKGYLNVLVTHGRVGRDGPNTLGKHDVVEVPSSLICKNWDYVALGDWHVHRLQPIENVPAYYAGSLEALTFSEATQYPARTKDENAIRGPIDLLFYPGQKVKISSLEYKQRRPVLRLDTIDAANLNATDLTKMIAQSLDQTFSPEALILLDIDNCSSDLWHNLEHSRLKLLRERVRRCDIRWNKPPETSQSEENQPEATLETQWANFLADQSLPNPEWYQAEGLALLEKAKEEVQRRLDNEQI